MTERYSENNVKISSFAGEERHYQRKSTMKRSQHW